MKIIPIVKAGEALLKAKAQPVTHFNTPELTALIERLFAHQRHYHGAGICAPQIGVSLQVLVYGVNHNPRYPDAPIIPDKVLINPEITYYSPEKQDYHEGCLSLPHLRGLVPRAIEIHYQAYTVEGKRFEGKAQGFEARVIQHEVDHLNGLLYPTRMQDMASFKVTET